MTNRYRKSILLRKNILFAVAAYLYVCYSVPEYPRKFWSRKGYITPFSSVINMTFVKTMSGIAVNYIYFFICRLNIFFSSVIVIEISCKLYFLLMTVSVETSHCFFYLELSCRVA